MNSGIYAYYLLYSYEYQYKRCKFLVPYEYGSDVRNSSRVSAGAPCGTYGFLFEDQQSRLLDCESQKMRDWRPM